MWKMGVRSWILMIRLAILMTRLAKRYIASGMILIEVIPLLCDGTGESSQLTLINILANNFFKCLQLKLFLRSKVSIGAQGCMMK